MTQEGRASWRLSVVEQGQDLQGAGLSGGQLWAHSLGLAQQQGLPQLLGFHFCQTLIRHLISTFIKCYFFKKTKQMVSI